MPQDEGVRVEDPATWSYDCCEDGGWKGPKLLYMAGLFDEWRSSEGEVIYSYTVITLESSTTLSWLHNRMPAILDGQQVTDWLDVDRIPPKAALSVIQPATVLTWHPVATLVNNSRNKDPQCNKPITLKPKPASRSKLLMESWLKKGTGKRESDREINESTVDQQETTGDVNSVITKKAKKEQNSAAL